MCLFCWQAEKLADEKWGLMKAREDLSINRINLEPKNADKNTVQLIMAYDLGGWKQGDIARTVGLTQSRVSIIMNSPLYKTVRNARFKELQEQIVGSTADRVLKGDPVKQKLNSLAMAAVSVKEELLVNAESEFVKNSVASDLLDRAGYKSESKKIRTSVEVTEKMADRFEKVLKMNPLTIKVKTEVTEDG